MTEPVAYWHIPQIRNEEIFVDFSPSKNLNFEDIPLYTAEQLHPRVKMTKEQHRQFENYKTNKNSFYHFWQSLLIDDVLFKDISERDLMLAWLDDGAIEIVPDMKWFVRSKTKNGNKYLYLKKLDGFVTPWYTVLEDNAQQFETKEEAELWKNPLTEAVHLPVEGE